MSAFSKQVGGGHYTKMKIQPFQYSMANGLDPMQHTIIKYVTRFRDKNGIEDLEKAKHTIDLLIEHESQQAAPQPAEPDKQHPDDVAVDAFAAAMKAKLKRAREEKGRGGWQDMSATELSAMLREHVEKGDPVDVANLAMMLHQNGQGITPAEPVKVRPETLSEHIARDIREGRFPGKSERKMVPAEPVNVPSDAEQALRRKLEAGEARAHIITSSYDRAQAIAIYNGWDLWVYTPAWESYVRQLGEGVAVFTEDTSTLARHLPSDQYLVV